MARKKPIKLNAPELCPVCGEDIPRGSLACPECGADHKSGWREDASTYDAVDVSDEDFNYDEFIRKEFGSGPKPAGVKTVWWIAAVILILILVTIYFIAAQTIQHK
jgi:uncharacterized membrane protein YvbJ